jgi:hypothetical protein
MPIDDPIADFTVQYYTFHSANVRVVDFSMALSSKALFFAQKER